MSNNETYPISEDGSSSPSPPPPPRARQVIERPGGMFESLDIGSSSTTLQKQREADISGDVLWGHVNKWKNRFDVWPVIYGSSICGFMAGASGTFIIHNIRKYLYLGHLGRMSSYFGTAFVPTIGLGISHQMAITNDILEQDTHCPVCVQVRAAVLQVVFGVAYPSLIAPFAIFPVMGRMQKSYKVPKLFEEPKAVLNYAKEMFKPWSHRLPYIAAAQVLISMGLTYLEQETYYNTILPEVRLRNIPINKTREESTPKWLK